MDLSWMAHCGHCGVKFTSKGVERVCPSCEVTTWAQNKTAIALAVPVWDHDNEKIVGQIITRRGIPPGKGEWALVSGFQDYMEHPKITAVREFQEEVLGEYGAENYLLAPELVQIMGVELGGGGNINIITARHLDGISISQWNNIVSNFKPNHEVMAIELAEKPIKLAFDIQTNLLISAFAAAAY